MPIIKYNIKCFLIPDLHIKCVSSQIDVSFFFYLKSDKQHLHFVQLLQSGGSLHFENKVKMSRIKLTFHKLS